MTLHWDIFISSFLFNLVLEPHKRKTMTESANKSLHGRCSPILWFCAYVVALNSILSPKCTKGILQASGLLNRVHRNLTSPPSLWPSRELRKYHYSLCLSSPPPEAIRFLLYRLNRSLPKGRSWRTYNHGSRFPSTQVMYLKNVYSIFKVQGGFVSPLTTQRTKKPKNSTPFKK